MNTKKISQKICLVGDFSVGKTSLIRRFVERQFKDQYLSTVGVKISRKSIEILRQETEEKDLLQLLIWDIEGQTKFKGITPSYLQGAKGAVIVADVTRAETLTHLQDHLNLFFSINPQGFCIVALNKADLLSSEELTTLLDNHKYSHLSQVIPTYTTSAKTGNNVDQIFQTLAHKII